MRKYSVGVFIVTVSLIAFGLIILLSASSTYAFHTRDDMYSLFKGQMVKAIFGVGLLILFSAIPYDYYKDYTRYMLLGLVIILVATLFTAPVKHAHRWINLIIFRFQPADAVKLFLVLHIAKMIEDKKELLQNFQEGFKYFLILIAVVAGLVIIQPNVSNAIIIVLIAFSMLFVAGSDYKHILISMLGVGIPAGSAMMMFSHSRARVTAFINTYFGNGDFPTQIQQAIIGLGSGGFQGLGLGNGKQKNFHLSEAYGDFIFAVIGEETGLVGTFSVLAAFSLLFYFGIKIAKNAKDTFGKNLAFGIIITIMLHALIHISVSVGRIPATGIPLPFISYGGTSLIVMCISVGILMSIGLSSSRDVLPEPLIQKPMEPLK